MTLGNMRATRADSPASVTWPRPPAELLAALRVVTGRGIRPLSSRQTRGLPDTAGSYLLIAHLPQPLRLRRGALTGRTLASGWYVYAGSARGPGGLRARLGRHLRRRKRLRWHIDRVTTAADVRLGLALPDPAADECALIAALLRGGGFAPALPGFGSSDCDVCPAHLLRWTGPHRDERGDPPPPASMRRGGFSAAGN